MPRVKTRRSDFTQQVNQELQATKMRKAQLKDNKERRNKRMHRSHKSSKALLPRNGEQQHPASDQNVDAADAGGGPNITASLENASHGGAISTFGEGGDDDEVTLYQEKNVLKGFMSTSE